MYRVTLTCDGVPQEVGAEAAIDIANAFHMRHWHERVSCTWDGIRLTLVSENDFDFDGLASMDEFSEEISANIAGGFDGDLMLVGAEEFSPLS